MTTFYRIIFEFLNRFGFAIYLEITGIMKFMQRHGFSLIEANAINPDTLFIHKRPFLSPLYLHESETKKLDLKLLIADHQS